MVHLSQNMRFWYASHQQALRVHMCSLITAFAASIHKYLVYSKTCVKTNSKIDKTKDLMTTGSLMKVESIAECFMLPLENSAILLTCIKR